MWRRRAYLRPTQTVSGLRCWLVLALALAPVACAHTPGASPGAPAEAGRPAPIEVLFERGHYALKADGTKSYSYEVRYRVKTDAGAEAWRRIEATWAPWFQARPELSATVTAPDGRVLELDPAGIEVVPVDDVGREQRLRVAAELPAIGVGAVVTQRIVQRDIRPASPAGASGRYYFGMRVPVARSELILELPADLPIALEVRGLELTPTVVEQDGLRRISYVRENLEAVGPVDKHLPDEVPRHPHVAFSTAPSWGAVAERFHAEVERNLRAAEVGALLKDVPKSALREEVAQAALTQAHGLVRPTGRRFGQGPRVPMHPEETLARGEGDDEDISLLVVALLRARGLDAHLALVRAGPGEDVRPELPGLEGFDRSLVRIDGPAPLWIDPLARYTPPGTLPPSLQGRWALVVDAETRALERTPQGASVDNHYLEERVFVLPAHGPANVIETTRATGAIGARLRAQLDADADPRPSIERYVGNHYGRARLGQVTASDPKDLSVPLEITLEALDTSAGHVDVTTAAIEVRSAVLFGWLPPLIRDAALASEAEPESREEELRRIALSLVARRTEPLELPEPYRAELRFQVRAPPGFEPVERPQEREVKLGPARFSIQFELRGGDLFGALRFDTGPALYAPDDVRALVRGLRDLWAEPVLRVAFEHRGARALREGRIREGIQSFAGLAAAHPESAEHRARLALALVEVGFGDAARQVAREAVALEETSVLARYVLGRVLAHDLVGRLHAPGFDREGAMQALQLVKALDPGHVRARADLALLRSVDERGLRFSSPAAIEAVVAEYRSLRQDTGVTSFDDDLIEALFRAGRFEEVILEAEEARRSLRRDGHVVAATVALDDNIDRVPIALETLAIPEPAVPLVRAAAATALAAIGRYELARQLLSRLELGDVALSPLGEQARRIEGIQPLDRLLEREDSPVRVVQLLLAKALAGEASVDALRRLMSSQYGPDRLAQEADRLERAFSGMARSAERARVPARVLRDGILSSTEYRVDGEPAVGFRVRALLEGRRPTWWFVRVEDGAYRVVATDASPGALGSVALEALEAGRPEVADRWLAWADELLDEGPRPGSDLFAELPFVRLRRLDPKEPRAAALALSALGPEPKVALEALARRISSESGVVRDALEQARLLGLVRADRMREALPLAERLTRRHPESGALYRLHVGLLVELERWGPARRKVLARLRERPEDPEALEQLANLETARGRFAHAEAILERLAERDEGNHSVVYNNLAWVSLFRGDVGPRDLERALKANALSQGQSPAELHTLAALHAERGDAEETLKLVRLRLELMDAEAPESMDYYLFGRVMEHLGLWRLARQAYLRVENDEGNRADSTHALAQRRLRNLDKRSAI